MMNSNNKPGMNKKEGKMRIRAFPVSYRVLSMNARYSEFLGSKELTNMKLSISR